MDNNTQRPRNAHASVQIKKRRLLTVLFAAAFALCWGVPKALYSKNFGIVWLIFVTGVCAAWLIVRPHGGRCSKKQP